MSDGHLIAGRYRLRRRVGAGAMGTVWEAHDERLDRVVAVKLLTAPEGTDDTDTIRRAAREARIAARVHHPNAVTVHDVVEDAGRPVLVMEYVPARTLADHGTLAPDLTRRVGAQIAAALAAAHRVGVVHRDVKPGNILLADDGTAKITDFGIARAAGDVTVTRTGLLAGTPAFLSPEAARGAQPGPASDVFSLGATLYAAVEGRPPFGDSDNAIALLHAVAAGRFDPPTRAGPLTDVLLTMLHTDPAARPTMAQAAELLGSPAGTPAEPPTSISAPVPATRLGAPLPPPTRVGDPITPQTPSRARRTVLIATAVVATVGLAGAAALLITRDSTTSASTQTTSATTTTTTSTPPAIAPATLRKFATEYYNLLPGRPEKAWPLLGPDLQAQAKGRQSYKKFWDDVDSLDIVEGPHAGEQNTVTVDIEYSSGGNDVTVETHRLHIIEANGTLLIDADEVVERKKVPRNDNE